MDATIVAAKHVAPGKAAGMGAAHPKEAGADWANKNGKSFFGYKLHVGIEEGSGLIRRVAFTDGSRRLAKPVSTPTSSNIPPLLPLDHPCAEESAGRREK